MKFESLLKTVAAKAESYRESVKDRLVKMTDEVNSTDTTSLMILGVVGMNSESVLRESVMAVVYERYEYDMNQVTEDDQKTYVLRSISHIAGHCQERNINVENHAKMTAHATVLELMMSFLNRQQGETK